MLQTLRQNLSISIIVLLSVAAINVKSAEAVSFKFNIDIGSETLFGSFEGEDSNADNTLDIDELKSFTASYDFTPFGGSPITWELADLQFFSLDLFTNVVEDLSVEGKGFFADSFNSTIPSTEVGQLEPFEILIEIEEKIVVQRDIVPPPPPPPVGIPEPSVLLGLALMGTSVKFLQGRQRN